MDPEKVQGSILAILKEIESKYEPCNTVTRKQILFRVGSTKAQELVFSRETSLYLFRIENDYVLHIIEIETHFSGAEFIRNGVNSNNVRDAFLKFWVLVYAGMPDVMFCDHGSAFNSSEWKELAEENGFCKAHTGTVWQRYLAA